MPGLNPGWLHASQATYLLYLTPAPTEIYFQGFEILLLLKIFVCLEIIKGCKKTQNNSDHLWWGRNHKWN